MTKDFYWQLRELAVSARCTPAQLCREAGISQTTTWRWKGNKTQPTMRSWGKITAAAEAIKQRAAA